MYNTLNDRNFSIIWKRGRIVFSTLRNGKDKIPEERRAGVYSVPIYFKEENSTKYYIGSTTRSLTKRMNEHKQDIANARLSTALAIKAYEHDISIDWKNVKMLRYAYHMRGLTTLEAIEIERAAQEGNLINDSGPINLPDSWKWCARNGF